MKRTWTVGVVGSFALALFVAGCSQDGNQTAGPTPQAKSEGDHGHKPGRHGGSIVEIGRDNYHAEVTFGEGGLVRLHMLARDEVQVMEVENQTLNANVRADGEARPVEFKLEARPRPDDGAGKTSVFEGTLPATLRDRPVEVIVTSIRIDGGRFRFAFRSGEETKHAEVAMPQAAPNEKVKRLFATAKGKYTAADIKANGAGKTAADVYGNVMSEHDDDPQPGDKVCPISRTKANPAFTWVVGGKKYAFCCTPCIEEFVKKAQEKPEQVKEPGFYVKR